MIKNNYCSEVVGTNGDVYAGTFNMELDGIDKKFMYIISFEKGTQARGNKVVQFNLCIINNDGFIGSVDTKKPEFENVLKEVLKGF